MEKKKELDEKRITQLEQQMIDQEVEMKAVKDDLRQIRAEEEDQFRWMPALLALYNDMNRYKRNFANQEYAGGTPFKLVDFIFLPQQKHSMCNVCWKLFQYDEEVAQLFCGHCFHVRCLARHFRIISTTCPRCTV